MGRDSEAPPAQLTALTGLRFWAALWVVLYHFGGTAVPQVPAPLGAWLAGVVGHGYAGVSFFFILSGFVLAYRYAPLSAGFDARDRRRFWRARAARIAPLYYAALLLSLPPALWSVGELDVWGWMRFGIRLMAEATFTHAWTPWTVCTINCPGWSLSAEAVMYALTPWLLVALAAVPRLRASGWLWVAALVPAVLYSAMRPPMTDEQEMGYWLFRGIKFFPLWHLPQFMLGLVAGSYYARGGRIVGWGALAAVIAGWMGFLLLFSTWELPYALVNNGLLAPLIVLTLLYLSSNSGVWPARILGSAGMVFLGEISFGFYLLQVPVAGWMERMSNGRFDPHALSLEQLALFVVCLAVCASAAYYALERPARTWILRRR